MIFTHCLQQNGYSPLYVIAHATDHEELCHLVPDDERLDAWMKQNEYLSALGWAAEKGDEALTRIFESDWVTPEYVMLVDEVCPFAFHRQPITL